MFDISSMFKDKPEPPKPEEGPIRLPAWASFYPSNPRKVVANGPAAYEAWMQALNVKKDKLDQYWLEVIHQCIKMDLMIAMHGHAFEIKITRSPKHRQIDFPRGRGPDVASRGGEARSHFKRVRGVLPA